MSHSSSKAVIQNKMKVEVSSCEISPHAALVDRGGMLNSSIHWPKGGSGEDLDVGPYTGYIVKYLS